MSWVKQEQDSLVETFRSTDPDAPTLCEGWNVRRLLAHLTQREQGPVARIADSVARKPPGQEPRLNKLTSQARTPQGYEALIDRFTRGAPRWSPMSWAAGRLNFVEYLIHHEDIRRAGTNRLGRGSCPRRNRTRSGISSGCWPSSGCASRRSAFAWRRRRARAVL